MNPVFATLPVTVFTRMSALALEHDAVNLGQGFPDSRGPEDVLAAAADALVTGSNQYPPMRGLPVLRQAIAAHYAHHQGLDLDWQGETIVTSGATEALAAAILGVVSPGEEVILFQPVYDSYAPMVRQAGGTPRFVTLQPPGWTVTREALDAALTPKTRAIVVNSPLNPSGTMLSEAELATLADFCVANDLIAICDEVWEHIVFDGAVHRPLMAMPGMRNRAVKIGSAGKIFSLTGWKVGWIAAAPGLAETIAKAHQFLTFTTPPNLQAAVAYGLAKDDSYFTEMRADYARSRDRLTAGLEAAGYAVLPSSATWFVSIDLPASRIAMDDEAFCLAAVERFGVAAIPVSAFYEEAPVTSVARLCFCKADETLNRGVERLARARARLLR